MIETNFPSTVALEIRGPIETQTMSKLYYSLKKPPGPGGCCCPGFWYSCCPCWYLSAKAAHYFKPLFLHLNMTKCVHTQPFIFTSNAW